MWQEVQMGIADVKFGARDAKEKNKVNGNLTVENQLMFRSMRGGCCFTVNTIVNYWKLLVDA